MYELWVFLHLVTVVVGIGGVILNGVYARQSTQRRGPEGAAVSEANYAVSDVAEKFVYAIPVFGVLAVLASDDAHGFGETWIWLSTVLYVVAVGITHAVIVPSHRCLNELGRQGGPEAGRQMAPLGKRLAAASALSNVLAVVIIALMVWKPGD